ncbi:MAG TPA: PASTA domain-containing protein, partial [Solirubrobacteraceae bacterium]|nr:PASTA domain-containing protein [Solirubrobacteraceae bacterium]
KLLYHRLAEDQQFVERFRREASSAASLQHPNIVGIFDRGEWDGTYYIAMEYVEGRTLKDIVRERGPAPPDAAVDVVLQILRAARFAHQRGVVHRDIKPQNVLIDEEGRIKVADFGIARAGASDMTETGSVMGTAQYLSPEQAQGRPVDARSDLYSIGIVLYEMLTGRVPFDAESPVTVALKQVSEAPMLPREIDPAIPPALEGVVMRALEKDPVQRFANADEFIEALHRARMTPDEVVVTAPAPMEEILEEEERSSRRWWLWLLILLAIAAIAFGLYTLLKPEQVKVPQVVGTQAATASQILQNKGFEVQQNNIESDDTPRGEVAGQNPRAGTFADEGSTVTINVSAGPGQVSVPTVAGQSQEEAESALREAGLDVTVEEVFSDTVDKGQVVDTSPVAGTLVERGTKVTLRVSKGAERVEVPDVSGQSEQDARSAIQGAGLRVGKVTEEESEEEPGTVLGQSPAAGKRVAKNSAVDLTVAKGVEIPDVVDETEDDATQILEEAGFEVRVRQRTVTTDDDVGIVLEQRPAEGEERAKGSRVTIIVGQLATSTPTPTPTATATPTVGP